MSDKQHARARAKARRLRELRRKRQRRKRIIISCVSAAAVVALGLTVYLLHRPVMETPAGEGGTYASDAPSEIEATDTPMASATPTPSPTPSPTPEPTAVPLAAPDVISFYRPEGKSYSPRVRMDDEFSARWKRGQDIGSFEVVASDADRLEGDFFAEIFGAAWTAFPDADRSRIGFALRYTLDEGEEISYTMLSPDHVQHTEYIECWLYDDYHREPHQHYSHIKSMKDDTLITSIKLTCGRKISHVQEIWLTAFVYTSTEDFDAQRNYVGPTSHTIHITRK